MMMMMMMMIIIIIIIIFRPYEPAHETKNLTQFLYRVSHGNLKKFKVQ